MSVGVREQIFRNKLVEIKEKVEKRGKGAGEGKEAVGLKETTGIRG